MDKNFSRLSIEELKKNHRKAESELQMALLNCVAWDELKEKREEVTQLAFLIYKRENPGEFNSPADTPFRNG